MRRFLIVGLNLLVLTASAQVLAQNPVRLSIATGGMGGIYYPLGSGLADLISKHVSDVRATPEVTGGSVDNCLLLSERKVGLGLAVADTAWNAFRGEGKRFKEKAALRTLAAVYPVFMHLVALQSANIEKVADLKDKAVSTGAPGSWTELTSTRILEAVRLNPDKDVKRSRFGPSESSAQLKEKRMEAYFWAGDVPTVSVTDLAASLGVKMRLVPLGDVVSLLNEKYGPSYAKGSIPAKTYPLQDLPVPTLLVWNLLLCHESMEEGMAYRIIRSTFEHQPELSSGQRVARFMTLEAQAEGVSPIPYHPGAARYFREKGAKVR